MIDADRGQIRQVLENLIVNANQALDGGGEISVELTQNGHDAIIAVRDTGPGISEELRDQLFEPLFTTKAKGTGLGLTICRQLIERHGGTIELQDNDGAGRDIPDSPATEFQPGPAVACSESQIRTPWVAIAFGTEHRVAHSAGCRPRFINATFHVACFSADDSSTHWSCVPFVSPRGHAPRAAGSQKRGPLGNAVKQLHHAQR
ncbi:MAG: HAMP domain-containing sensor histidine kinase [Fuerstiella sp.]